MSSESDSPELQKAKTFFQYGNDAVHKSNFDYAINMYREACKLVPDNMVYRQSLRGAQRKKFNNDPKKVGKLVGMSNQPTLMKAKSARSKGRYPEALDICEDAFINNPWDVGAARVAAEAAEHMGLGSLAQWYVESVQTVARDVDFFKFSAHIHELNESWQKAIACWEQVKKLHPNDQDVNRKINALSAAGTIKRAGLDEALDQRAAQAQAQASADAAESRDAILAKLKQEQLSPEQRMIKEIMSDPTAVHAYIGLADLYRQRSDLQKAEKVLAKGLKANPKDVGLLSVYEDTQISRLKRAIELQTHRVQERPEDTGVKVKLDELTEMLNKYEIQAYRRRVKLHPDDAKLHYELGVILARTGSHDEAIAEFQQARATSSPELKIQALYQAGLCFEANSAPKLADRNYREALKLLESEDKETFNALHYRLGRVAEALGNNEAAEEHYNEVAANDYAYLDVAQRLRRLI
jgi:tetratricopeptide (TPR) repeat protein